MRNAIFAAFFSEGERRAGISKKVSASFLGNNGARERGLFIAARWYRREIFSISIVVFVLKRGKLRRDKKLQGMKVLDV